MTSPVYDSAAPPATIAQNLRSTWRSRGLLRVLVARDLAVRYKRSALGVWWTLLNPMLEMAVLWVVFSEVFRFSIPGVPYAVYVLSGLVVFNLFRQTLVGTAGAMLNHAEVLRKVRVAPAVFSLSTAGANLVTFAFTCIPLAVILAVLGPAPNPWVPLAVPLVLAVAGCALGLGLALAPVVTRFPDTRDLLLIVTTLVGYLAPVFYPFDIVPERFQIIEQLNPLFHFVQLFRELLYGSGPGDPVSWAAVALAAVASLLLGHVVHRALRAGAFAAL